MSLVGRTTEFEGLLSRKKTDYIRRAGSWKRRLGPLRAIVSRRSVAERVTPYPLLMFYNALLSVIV
ncbi:MAG TPA: hypothetical protein VFS38_05925 [Actinomycetota bacterium]|nr:hypothetical protein [Actinomycetota bacterium]